MALIVPCRLAYPKLFSAEEFDGKRRYTAVVCIPKEDEASIAKLKEAAATAARGEWKDNLPNGFKNPIKDGDAEGAREEFRGFWYIKVGKNENQGRPGVIDGAKKPIDDPSRIRSGDNCNVHLSANAYNLDVSKGVNFYLNNVQLVSEGDPIGGAARASDVFDAIETAGSPSESGDAASFFK